MNRHGEIRCRVLCKDCKSNSDHPARGSKQWSTRTAFTGARVIRYSASIEISNVALRCQRLDVFCLRQVVKQGLSRAIAILNALRFAWLEHRQQTVRAGRIAHRDYDTAHRHRIRSDVEGQGWH